MPLKPLRSFRRSLEMPLKNCKVELRLISTNHGALSPNRNDNDDANYNNIILLSKTKVTLPAKDN